MTYTFTATKVDDDLSVETGVEKLGAYYVRTYDRFGRALKTSWYGSREKAERAFKNRVKYLQRRM